MMTTHRPKMDEAQIADLRGIFRSFDRNKDGCLTQIELASLIRSIGLNPSSEEPIDQRADTNSNGLVEFTEFLAMVAPEIGAEEEEEPAYGEEQLRQLFRVFDRDGNGYITAAELAHSMARLGHELTAEEVAGMIREADTDGDGRISFPEFSCAISSAAFLNSWA